MKIALIKFNIKGFFLHPLEREVRKETSIIELFSRLLFSSSVELIAQLSALFEGAGERNP
jgi:hypothetical protein